MTLDNRELISELNRLYHIAEAGERGFATASANDSNTAIKLLLKSYALQRARFQEEIEQEVHRLDGEIDPGVNPLGAIHRGRVAIFAAMTIEDDRREKMILKEAALGERYARKAYEEILKKDLPSETRAMIERQYHEVLKVIDQLNLLRGAENRRMIVQVMDSQQQAVSAARSIERAGIPAESIDEVPLRLLEDEYKGRGTTVLETALSSAVGGIVWGTLIGVLAGFGATQTSLPAQIGLNSEVATFVLVTVSTILLAALLGGILGLVIGMGISQGDEVEHEDAVRADRRLFTAVVDASRAQEARKIVDRESQQAREAPARASS